MEITSSYKKCPKCGTFNTDRDICKKCGEIISQKKKQQLREKKMLKKQIELLKEEEANLSFVQKMKIHRFLLIRIIGFLLYSVFFVVSLIVSGLAWFFAMVMAG